MKKDFKLKTVTPKTKWAANVPQQIKEIISKNTMHEAKIIEYAGNWNGVEYDSAKIQLHKSDIPNLEKFLNFN